MGQNRKICRDCGTETDTDAEFCPVCRGTHFRYPEDDGTNILRFRSSEEPQEDPDGRIREKPAEHLRCGSVLSRIAVRYGSLPDLTRKLILILAVVAAVLTAVVAAAGLSGSFSGEQGTASASPSASASAGPEPSSASATAAPDGTAIGSVMIIEDLINVRTEPDTDAPILGVVEKETGHDVYEIRENDGYVWYRIGPEEWIADGGEWLSYTEAGGQ